MKKILLVTLGLVLTVGLLAPTKANAFTLGDIATPKVQKIALTCAAGIVVSTLTGADSGVGLAICAATATYIIVEDYHNPNRGNLKDGVDSFLKDAKSSLDKSLKSNKEEYAIYQEAIRRIILEKLSEVQGTSEKQIEKYMQSPSFEAFLKEKTSQIILSSDDAVSDRLAKAKEEIRKQVTEDVLRDVIDSGSNQ